MFIAYAGRVLGEQVLETCHGLEDVVHDRAVVEEPTPPAPAEPL